MPKKMFTARLPEALVKELEEIASTQNLSQTDVFEMALREHFQNTNPDRASLMLIYGTVCEAIQRLETIRDYPVEGEADDDFDGLDQDQHTLLGFLYNVFEGCRKQPQFPDWAKSIEE